MPVLTNLDSIYQQLGQGEPQVIAVAQAADEDVLRAVQKAVELRLAQAVLCGKEADIRAIAEKMDFDLRGTEVIDCPDASAAARTAVACIRNGKAHVLMKGLLETSVFMKAVIDREAGLRVEGNIINAVAIIEYTEGKRLVFLSDAAFTPAPDFEAKLKIIKNTVAAARYMGVEKPKVAMLAATETPSPHMPSTSESRRIQEMCEAGEIKDCVIAGPISLDLAMSAKAAAHKGYHHPVAGQADILIAPDLEVGNVLYKSMAFLAHMRTGGFVLGAAVPIIFTSRADSVDTKLNTIAASMLLARRMKDGT